VQADTDIVVAGSVQTRKGNAVDIASRRCCAADPYREEIRVWMKTRTTADRRRRTFPRDRAG
jgi:hypothetical protein